MASEFGKPRQCYKGCGTEVYFDRNSSVGYHDGKWFPLEVSKDGLRTDTKHQCPNRHNGKVVTIDNAQLVGSSQVASNCPVAIDNLAVIKQIAAALNEYIAIKEVTFSSQASKQSTR
jgi:hypothetical protein